MTHWLNCTISLGQFDGEYAVKGSLFNGAAFSLFASVDDLEFSDSPKESQPVRGYMRVVPLEERDDLTLVSLPQPSFENGRTITVKKAEISLR